VEKQVQRRARADGLLGEVVVGLILEHDQPGSEAAECLLHCGRGPAAERHRPARQQSRRKQLHRRDTLPREVRE
jgi:hypothetical protein